jgi:cell division protein FtsI/penicillin-binding protein 2
MSPETSQAVKSILQTSVERNNKAAVRAGYAIGAKSGTAELVGDDGEYKEGSYNGTYVGYVSGKNKTYVLVVRLDEPKTSGYASTQASITWEQITNEMLNSVAVEPL